IGTRLPVRAVGDGIADLVPRLSASDEALAAVAEAICTTDSRIKVATVSVAVESSGDEAATSFRVSGLAKGVGMIHPHMATMLSVVLTDARAEPALLHDILRSSATRTWNQLSVDGDSSTNDTVFLLAS